jgi:hypothetical protein
MSDSSVAAQPIGMADPPFRRQRLYQPFSVRDELAAASSNMDA